MTKNNLYLQHWTNEKYRMKKDVLFDKIYHLLIIEQEFFLDFDHYQNT